MTDVTNASRTQLMNLETLEWDPEHSRRFWHSRDRCCRRLPPAAKSTAQRSLHAIEGVAIAGILGDQQAALVGQTCFNPGEAKNTYGTGCFLLMNTGETAVFSKFGLLTTVAYKFGAEPARYALEGSIAITGALVQWLRDNLGLIEKQLRHRGARREPSTTTAASTSFPRSPACTRPTGRTTRAA